MIDALGEWMMQPAYFSRYGGHPARRTGARHASIAPYGPYRVGDGSSVFLGVQNDREWKVLCSNVIGRPELVDDPRFAENTELVAHNHQITEILESTFALRTADEVIALLDEEGIACARLRSPAEFTDHPQLAARNRWRSIDTPGGPVEALLPPVTVHGQEPLMRPVPHLGAHTEALRAEFLPAGDRTEA